MDFQDAIRKIEERGDFNRYAEVKPVFEEQLKSLNKDDHTERGLCYYYLLVSYLKAQLVHETEESVDFFERMDRHFLAQEAIYKKGSKFSKGEIEDFYRLMERCYNSLEFLYQKHDFKDSKAFAYNRKMRFRKDAYLFNKKYGSYLEYKFLEVTCLYGTSIFRWALTVLIFMFVMSIGYMLIDTFLVAVPERMIHSGAHWFDYFYFSIIVLTTVGLGDIVPLSVEGKFLVASEAFFGFIMLGVFMGMMQKKL